MPAEQSSTLQSKATEHQADSLHPYAGVVGIAICGVCALLDLYCTQPILPMLTHVLHASKAAAGLTVSASTLGVAVAAPIVGSYAEHFNRKKVIVRLMLALAVPTLLAATSHTLIELIFWRFLQGILMPGIFSSAIAYVTEEWVESKVAIVMAIYVSGTVLGGYSGRLIAGVVAHHLGWHMAFIVLGLANLAGGTLVGATLPQAKQSPKEEGPPNFQQIWSNLLRHLRNRDLLITFAIAFNILFTLVATFSYVTFHLAAPPYSLSTSALGMLFSLYLVGLVVTPAGGVLLTRIGLRAGLLGAVALSLTGILITLLPPLRAVLTGLTLCCTGAFVAHSAAMSRLKKTSRPEARVSAAGLYLSCYYIGGSMAGIVPGLAWKLGHWVACVVLIAGMHLATIGLAFFGWDRSSKGSDQAT